jgi:hypothetical protein
MHEPAARVLDHWQEFYVLLGMAAAALVALLFVAVSVASSFIGSQRAAGLTAGIRTYLSPVIFHFTAIIVICLIALVPVHTRLSLALVLGVAALIGASYAAYIMVRVLRHHAADIPDRLGYGIIPTATYLACLVAAQFIGMGYDIGPLILAGAVVALLLDNMRNAWDLMLSLAHRTVETARTYGKTEG